MRDEIVMSLLKDDPISLAKAYHDACVWGTAQGALAVVCLLGLALIAAMFFKETR